MKCEGFIRRLGLNCREVGDGTIAIETPFTFCDGEPIGFYLRERNESIFVSDNADTLTHLLAVGMDLSDRRKWKGLRESIAPFGFSLQETGEITGEASKASGHSLFSKYIGAMLVVADYEREYLGLSEEQDQYIKEVEMYLREWKPRSEIETYVMAQGHSGRFHRFHFEQDNTLIDAARPQHNRTGAILRKAADVINTGTNKKIMVVMDDREDLERAKVETDILSTMVSVMSFSTLSKNVNQINPLH
jgi:hypothetical protein